MGRLGTVLNRLMGTVRERTSPARSVANRPLPPHLNVATPYHVSFRSGIRRRLREALRAG